MSNYRPILLVLLMLILAQQVCCQLCSVSEPNVTADAMQLQVFTSPGYNGGTGSYTRNMDCWWIIDSGATDLEILIFLTYDTSCPGDKIYIYDGISNTSNTLVHDLCGTVTEPVSYSTTQRYARIEMKTDGSTENAGFKLEYIASKDYSRTGCASTEVLITTNSYQYLSSPNFPSTYPSNSNCRWHLYNPYGIVDIDVLVSDIEDDDPTACNYDKYQMYDGEHRCDNNVIQMVCSSYPNTFPFTYTSNGTSVVVTFVSDSSVNHRGFILRFKGTNVITTTSGTLSEYSVGSTKEDVVKKKDTQAENKLRVEIIIGLVCGSVVLLCFTIIIVVCIVTRVNVPSERSRSVTPTEIMRRSPSIAWSVRSRKPSKTSQGMTIPRSIFITEETSTGSRTPNGAPPRATSGSISLSHV